MMMNQEPAVGVAGITAAATAVLALLTAFGLPLTDTQTAAILGVVAVIGPLVVGFVARGQVVPKANVAAKLDSGTGRVTAGEAAQQNVGESVRVVTDPGPPEQPV